jgi:hypothetical protein
MLVPWVQASRMSLSFQPRSQMLHLGFGDPLFAQHLGNRCKQGIFGLAETSIVRPAARSAKSFSDNPVLVSQRVFRSVQ